MREPLLTAGVIPDIDVGGYAADAIFALRSGLAFLFNAIQTVVGAFVDQVESLLTAPPSLVVIAIFTVIAFAAKRTWILPLFTAASFLLIESMGRFGETMQTLALVLTAAVLAVAIGIPVGILAARRERVSAMVKPVLDFMQTMPSFVYLLLAVFFFGIGRVPGVMSSLVFAMPPAVRLTELGIRGVDREVVEAANSFGARPREVLTGVQLPLARASIMAGVNQVIMLALSMVVIAGLGGAPGLGATVVRGVQTVNIGMGVEGGLAVVILAIFLDRVTAAIGAEKHPKSG